MKVVDLIINDIQGVLFHSFSCYYVFIRFFSFTHLFKNKKKINPSRSSLFIVSFYFSESRRGRGRQVLMKNQHSHWWFPKETFSFLVVRRRFIIHSLFPDTCLKTVSFTSQKSNRKISTQLHENFALLKFRRFVILLINKCTEIVNMKN